MPKFQLYCTGMKFSLPWSVRYSRKTGVAVVNKKELINQVYTYWPNGAPCTFVNVWLQGITFRSTGDSAQTFALHISHYIRDCYNHNVKLFEINDEYLCNFSERLINEKRLKDTTLHDARSPNHVAYTIRRVLDLLIWYQIHYRLTFQQKIIGELGTGARVTIEWRTDNRGHPVLHHPAIPTKRPPVGDKKPMPDEYIGKITDTINSLREKPRRSLGLTVTKDRKFIAKNEYLYCRRMTTIKLTQLTGLRPDELNNIPLHLNLEPMNTRRLFIPTLKTRQKSPPIREFPLTLEDALELSMYLHDRKSFLEQIRPASTTHLATNSFLLGHDGLPIATRSLARDFKRICNLSGLTKVQVCLSMFRHRFITTQIAYEIRKELKRDVAQKDLWQEAVQRKILSRVSKLTGHTIPMSLQSYFDEAFALAIANSFERTPHQTQVIIESLERSIKKLSEHSSVHLEPNLVKEIAHMEKILIELKSLSIATHPT